MDISAELKLSYYRELGSLNEKHGVKIVQHIETGRVFVLKKLQIYDLNVFKYLRTAQPPGVPHIEELIEEDGFLYVIEEYVSGISLRELISKNGSLCEAQAMDILSKLARILIPLHIQRPPIVHRDIKPENIIIRPDGQLVLVDFNSARKCVNGGSQDTVLFGTAGYAAPEQYGFCQSEPTADIYAVGVLLNEMLTGCMPGERRCKGRLGQVVDRCLNMEPGQRYQSMEELMKAAGADISSEVSYSRRKYRRFLPPGFRSGKLGAEITAAIWYILIIYMSCSLQIKDTGQPAPLLERITFFLCFIILTFWLGNYLDVWQRLPLSRSKNKFRKVLGIALWGYLMLFVPFLLMAIISSFL